MAVTSKTVNSSNLSRLDYDDETKILTVTFKGGGVYEYYDVEEAIFQAIINERFTNQKGEPSVGGSFVKLVKNNTSYKWKKIK